jgi:hypothetical protein
MLRTTFAAVALFCLTCALRTPASGATLTCVATHEITEAQWAGDPFIARLRDQGLKRPGNPFCRAALLSGEIKTGDARAVEAMVQANLPFLEWLALNSNGGSVDEAMQIGRVARRYYLMTEAPNRSPYLKWHWTFSDKIIDAPDDICASACFFTWLGGTSRKGTVLGLHRPFPSATEMQKLSPADAGRLYHDLSGKVIGYLTEMDAAQHWLSDMMKIPSNDLYVIPEKQVKDELEGDTERFSWDIPSLAQWKFAKCGALSVNEWNELKSLWQVDKPSEYQRKRLNYLGTKSADIDWCGEQAVKEARWRLRGANLGTER